MMGPVENLYYAIGELAYAIASADGVVQKEERQRFRKIVSDGLRSGEQDLGITDIIFQVLDKGSHFTDALTAYDWAMKEIRLNSHYLSPELKKKFTGLIRSVAEAYPPVTVHEKHIIDKFNDDIAPLEGDPVYYNGK